MAKLISNWHHELEHWLEPFLIRLGHTARRRMCPLYIAGLIGPGERKSVQPMATRLAPGEYDQLHHFVAGGTWDAALLEAELLAQADRLVSLSAANDYASLPIAYRLYLPQQWADGKRCSTTLRHIARTGWLLWYPEPGHQIIDAFLWPAIHQAGQQISEVGLRIDTIQLTGLDQRS